jgi:hypothetical protein
MAQKTTVAELLIEVGLDAKDADAAAKKLDKRLKDTKKSALDLKGGVMALGKALAGLATVAIGAGVAMFGLVNKATQAGDAIGKGAKQAGLSTDEYQKLGFAAERSGTNIDTMSRAVRNQSRFMREASMNAVTPFTKALAEVGLQLEDLEAQDTVTKRLGLIGDALSVLDDEARKVDLAMKLVGEEAGPRLLPFLAEGTEGIKALGDQAERLGGVLGKDAIAASEGFQDTITNATTAVKGIATVIATDLIPDFTEAVDTVKDFIVANKDMIRQRSRTFFKDLVQVMRDLVPILKSAASLIGMLAKNLDLVAGIVVAGALAKGLAGVAAGFGFMEAGATAALGPIGAIIKALGLLMPLAIRAGNALGDSLGKSDQFIKLQRRVTTKSFAGTSVGKQIVATSNEIRSIEQAIGGIESGDILKMASSSRREQRINELKAQRDAAVLEKTRLEGQGELELLAAEGAKDPFVPKAVPVPGTPKADRFTPFTLKKPGGKKKKEKLSINTISDLLGAASEGSVADLAASTPSTKGMEPTVAVEIFNNNVTIDLVQNIQGNTDAKQIGNEAAKVAQRVFSREIAKAGQALAGNVTR